MMEGKLAGIDYGRSRIGIAVSDPLGITAQPLIQLDVEGFEDAVGKVALTLEENGVTRAVYGLPYNMDGSVGEMGREVELFASKIEEKTGLPSDFFDERLCTVEAEGLLDRAGFSKKKKKARLDIVSAQIMLQSYMQVHCS